MESYWVSRTRDCRTRSRKNYFQRWGHGIQGSSSVTGGCYTCELRVEVCGDA